MPSLFAFILCLVISVKIRKQEYGSCNIIGKNAETLRKEKGLSQKDFIAKLQTM